MRVAVSKVRMPRSQRIMFSLAVRHDVLGAHQQLLNCVRKAAFDEYWLARLAELLQQLEVLHIARAYLNHVDFLKEGADGSRS